MCVCGEWCISAYALRTCPAPIRAARASVGKCACAIPPKRALRVRVWLRGGRPRRRARPRDGRRQEVPHSKRHAGPRPSRLRRDPPAGRPAGLALGRLAPGRLARTIGAQWASRSVHRWMGSAAGSRLLEAGPLEGATCADCPHPETSDARSDHSDREIEMRVSCLA